MNVVEERFVHFCCCLEWLNESWALLQALRNHSDHALFLSSFRFALILYAKPYRVSLGKVKRQHRLDTAFVPDALVALHDEVLNERDKLHAHSDLTLMDAQLTVRVFEDRQHAVMVRNHLSPTRLAARLDEIINLVEQTIDRMYVEVKKLEAQLPPTRTCFD